MLLLIKYDIEDILDLSANILILSHYLELNLILFIPGKDQSASKALRTDGKSTLVSSLLGTVGDGSLLSSSLSSPWRDRTASLFRSAGGLNKVSGARSRSAARGELLFSVFWKLRLNAFAEENTSPRVRINKEYELSVLHLSIISRSLSSVRYGSCFPGKKDQIVLVIF